MVDEERTGEEEEIDERVSDVSMALSTAENRVEYAGVEVESTREAIADVDGTEPIDERVDGLHTQVEALQAEIEDLEEALQKQERRRDDPVAAGDVRDELDRIGSRADDLQARADRVVADASDLERLADDPPLAVADLEPEVNALETFQDDLESTIEVLRGVIEDDETVQGDPGMVWFESTVRHRFRSLAIEDIRAEIEDLRTLSDGDDAIGDLQERFDEVQRRWEQAGTELDDIALDAWTELYGDRIDEAEQRVAEFSPPVDWEAASEALKDVLSGSRTSGPL